MKIEKLPSLLYDEMEKETVERMFRITMNKINEIIDSVNDLKYKSVHLAVENRSCECACHYPERLVFVNHSPLQCRCATTISITPCDNKVETKILPCPFCGIQPVINGYEGNFGICCDNDKCPFYVYFLPSGKTKQEVINAWNKREN